MGIVLLRKILIVLMRFILLRGTMEKELINNNLDLFDCSKVFLSNIKVLKKHQKICKRKIKEINNLLKSNIGDTTYLNSNKECYINLLCNIDSTLKISSKFITSSGTDKETLLSFYMSLYEIYLEEGNKP